MKIHSNVIYFKSTRVLSTEERFTVLKLAVMIERVLENAS
jgi:hypothetical protein